MRRFIQLCALLIKFSRLPAKDSAAPWWLSSQSEFQMALITKCNWIILFFPLSELKQKKKGAFQPRFSCCVFLLVSSPVLSQKPQGLLELSFIYTGGKKAFFLGRSKSTETRSSGLFLPQFGLPGNRLNSVEKPQDWSNEHSPCLITG